MLLPSTISALALALPALGAPLPSPVPPAGFNKITAIPAFNITGFQAAAVVLSNRV